MLVIPRLLSYNGVEVYYLKGLPIVISFRDVIYLGPINTDGSEDIYIFFFFLEMGSLMTSSSSAGPIQILKFQSPGLVKYTAAPL